MIVSLGIVKRIFDSVEIKSLEFLLSTSADN